VWMAAMAVYDQGAKYWLESNFNQQWCVSRILSGMFKECSMANSYLQAHC